MRRAALVLAGAAVIAAGGCGRSEPASSTGLRLQRQDLLVVSRALQRVEGPVAAEVAATKVAWPLIANGLPADTSTVSRGPIRAAAAAAAKLKLPSVFEETPSAALTGPGAAVAGLFRSYSGLATHGWQQIDAAIDQIAHGTPTAARFARANVALYIESVYDGHFNLAQVGKGVRSGYLKLGGARVFGATLTQPEVDALARTYSEANDRLHPHVGVRLGS
ncbi:MAG: hypothetical protein JWL67_2213 [Solirubrobacterales bacterium]|jgi:hypothetical protein|nr:hypothetical protein [Solirubrobacterales bacterium]